MKTTQLFDLSGRTALITGAAGHLGRVFSETLLELGARVVMMDIEPKVIDVASTLDQTANRAYGVVTDMENESALRDGFARALQWGGGLDILINNAAFVGTSGLTGWGVPFEQQEGGTFRRALEVNLTSVFTLCQLATPHLSRQGHGKIINIASIYGVVGPDLRLYGGTAMGNPAAYAASKAGVLQLTRWLAMSLAPNICVNAITPGGIERGQAKSFHDRYCERTPLGRMAKEDDFRGAVAYLASDASSYVTGQNLIVDGGWTVW